jgi:protein-tyrosine phosphatase
MRHVFHAFASAATFPAVYYCAAGKDRTGMLTAVLLKALGVSDHDIVADYLLTEGLTLERLQERLRAQGKDLPLALIRPQPETMERFLCQFDRRFGSVERYLTECGVGSQTLWSMRTNLLDW